MASALYVFNGLFDLQADRLQGRKRFRPLASGVVSVPSALVMMAIGFGFGTALALLAGGAFVWLLIGYAVMGVLYTLLLQQVALLNVVVLGALYCARIIGGALVAAVAWSSWLLIILLFLVLGLGMATRFTELPV
jgi:4-hydroxybenzoate polyprenyltransferase